ncbi:MAG: thiolase family protein [Planctomycetes bacterium]|nr:thiolase family protein [Planctomycetota bacterium]
MNTSYIVAAKRAPIGKFLGVFKSTSAVELAVQVTKNIIETAKVPSDAIDEVIYANARQAGNGPNIARQVTYKSGIPVKTPAFTVNKACASSIKTVVLGHQAIILNDADIVLAGGVENMSKTPFILPDLRTGLKLGHTTLYDGQYLDGFVCPLCGLLMGETAENLAEKYQISRAQQDEYAYNSQMKCKAAMEKGAFKDEIAPITLSSKNKTELITTDEHPRPETTLEGLSSLPTAFKKNGSVTAGNACGIADTASSVLLASENALKKYNFKPIARIIGYSSCGVDPKYMGIGPVEAVNKLLKKTGMKLNDFGLIELNEAFAVQVLACQKDLGFDMSITNVNGGAIALGHPIGATGARIITTLIHEARRKKVKYALAALCVSGGLGMAVSFEIL